ncbi:GNAT family N-acetyltransferase [Paenibacillus chungangensis]|uniref:GNAT family N-acetyltransferase n=1 Tax=Paenibacillus chungangensis TaxID=696535 RepID=A0ABW3HUC2_9BACL
MISYQSIDGPRACERTELSDVIQLVDSIMRSGSEQSVLTDYPLVYEDHNLDNVRIIKADNQVVSVVPFIPRQIELEGCEWTVGIISPTATSPHHRRKGYASTCLQDCINLMDGKGIELSVLWTKVETFPFYESAGYCAVQNQGYQYRCEKNDVHRFKNDGDEIVELELSRNPEWLESIQFMHQKEASHVVRRTKEYRYLFTLPEMKTLLAVRNGIPTAYLVVSQAVNKPGLIEGGGDENSLESLLHFVLQGLGDTASITGYAYLTSSVLGNVLERKLASKRRIMDEAPMMIRINQKEKFIGKISKLIECKNQGRGWGLSHQDLMGMSRRDLTSVLFGRYGDGPVQPAERSERFPLAFPIWLLDRS